MHYLPDAERTRRMTTDELRQHFLVTDLFREGEVSLRIVDLDRVIVGGIVPTKAPLELGVAEGLRTQTFTERREVGLLNIGGSGRIVVDDAEYMMSPLDMLYIGCGDHKVELESLDADVPARFYLVSYPSHAVHPTMHIRAGDADETVLGTTDKANVRRLRKYVRPGAVDSAQLVMGVTVVEEGSVWNTMPAHTHQRRTEVYMYFGLPSDAVVFHFMGEPAETRSLIVRDGEAVLSPGWSIHAGAGTAGYSFCWAMGGENQDFSDMQFVAMQDLR
jgi:4-deoxy-L-threo-5-hexosulose-uronate ketol-isomerase